MQLAKLFCAASMAAFFGSEPAIAADAPPAQQAPQTVQDWANQQLHLVTDSCSIPGTANKSMVPSDLSMWGMFAENASNRSNVDKDRSVEGVFDEVWLWNGQWSHLAPIGDPLGPIDDIIFRNDVGNYTNEHNCVTLLVGTFGVNGGVPMIKAALDASVNSNNVETSYIYGGHFLSPIALAIGKLPGGAGTLSKLPVTGTWLAIWDWYDKNSSFVTVDPSKQIYIHPSFSGLAIYRMKGLTQDAMLKATAQANVGIPLVQVNGGGSASINSKINVSIADYSVEVFSYDTPIALPQIAEVKANLQTESDSLTYASQPKTVQDPAPFVGVLVNIPADLCLHGWEIATPKNTAASSLSNLSTANLGDGSCKFSASLTTPKNSTGDSVSTQLAITRVIRSADQSKDLASFVIYWPAVSLPDERNDISLENYTNIPASIQLSSDIAAPAGNLNVTYNVKETGSDKANNFEGANLALTCGSFKINEVLGLRDGDLLRTNGNAALTLHIPVPSNIVSASQTAQCQVDGSATLAIQSGPNRSLTLQTYGFNVSRVTPPSAGPK